VKKIQVALDPALLAAFPGTIASTVRDALAFADWCRRQMADGWTIVAIRGERTREPMLPFATKGET
jgi:hypothetical protein